MALGTVIMGNMLVLCNKNNNFCKHAENYLYFDGVAMCSMLGPIRQILFC